MAFHSEEASLNSDLTDGSIIMPPSAKKRKIPCYSEERSSHKLVSAVFEELDEVVLNSDEESDLEENYLEYIGLPYLFERFKGSDGSDSGPGVSPHLDEDGKQDGACKVTTTTKLQGLPSATTTKGSATTTEASATTTETSSTTTEASATTTEASGTTTEASGTTKTSSTTTEASATTTEASGTTTEASATTTEASATTKTLATTTEASATTTETSATTTEALSTTAEASATTTEASGTTTEACTTTTEASGTITEASAAATETSSTTTEARHHTRGSTNHIGALPTKQAFISFLETYPTNQWNQYYDKVYKFLNVTACIVDPRYFLSISAIQNSEILSMDRIFSRMEKSKCRGWSTFPDVLEEFLDFYDYGFEQLSNRLRDSEFAYAELSRFKECMDFARKDTESTKLQLWYSQFVHHFKDIINIIKTGSIEEVGFREYVKNLIKMFVDIADLPVNESNRGLRFHLSQGKRKDKWVPVNPDICIYGQEAIILVGETKKIGKHGQRHKEQRGSISKDRGGTPQKTVLQGAKHKLDNAEPMPRPSTGPAVRGDAEDGGNVCRRFDRREDYKIRRYLPQLLGQLLCAMQNNEKTFPLGCESENVQLGFGVEGFKLRFVKLVLRDYMGVKISRPTVTGLFDELPFKCDVFITQEFNLLKKTHLRMFFKMLVAIIFVCEQ